ncbi:MAG: GDSL-type esterase/lipase family protein [Opitutaceae bacterium]|jgi:lysophospholipase L1-like esterase|nr:GDSL-type esterase/lipase family protein [Opitutaceae bacterium]
MSPHHRNITLAALAFLATGLAQTASAAPSSGADGFYLKDGDRVVFYGDSITDQRLYNTYVETFVVTRFPAMNVAFTHSGWGGDRVGGGGGGKIDVRLERDVYAYNPTVMTVMLGMNDGSYRAFDQKIFDTYQTGMRHIVDSVREKIPGIRMTLIQPSPYDDVTREPKFPGGYNEVLVRYGAAVKEIAADGRQLSADFNAPLVAVLEKAKAADATLAEKIIPDRVHPGPAGALIMAGALLKSWNAPAVVSDVAIDAAAGKITAAQNTRAADLAVSGDVRGHHLVWTQLDDALPMPVDMGNAAVALAVKSSDFTDTLNRQLLRVTGLVATDYELVIDGKSAGAFAPAQLARGINLATLDTPMTAQAAEVHKLTHQRANTHNTRWRTYQVPYAGAAENLRAAIPALIKAFDETDAALAALQRATARPVPRRYELKGPTITQVGETASPLPVGTGANLALNKKWKSSAPNTQGWDKGLTDGIWTGKNPQVYATDAGGAFPKTVTIDLERASTLGHVLVGVPDYGSTKTVAVSISENGNDFTEVGRHDFTLKKAEKCLFNFKPESARYVRLTYVENHKENAGFDARYAFTADVQVFAPVK